MKTTFKVNKKINKNENKIINDLSFKKWFGKSKVVDKKGEPLLIYHGSTHDFNKFTTKGANVENWHGKGIYFSSCEDDVMNNYSLEGPDLKMRISSLAEKLMMEKDLEEDSAIMKAKIKLKGPKNILYKTYIKMENPLILDGNNSTYFDFQDNYNEEEDNYDDKPTGKLVELMDTLRDLINEYSFNGNTVSEFEQEMYDKILYGEGCNAEEFEKYYRECEALCDLSNDEGDLMNHEILKEAYKRIGFDGVILHNPKKYFKNMNMSEDVIHYVIFDPNNIKIEEKEDVDY